MIDAQAGTPFGHADLTDCDREVIHVPGCVQPHGVLLVLSPELIIEQASQNSVELLGVDVEHLVGCSLADLVDQASVPALIAALERPSLDGNPWYLETLSVGPAGRSFEVSAHRVDGSLTVELEPADPEDAGRALDSAVVVRNLLAEVCNAPDLVTLSSLIARRVRELTGFDRVWVYRFHPDEHGEIIAEDRIESLPPYLGLHYPASDIPLSARQLFLKSWLRVIHDSSSAPANLLPPTNPRTGRPLDMTHCALRAVSPIHAEYLHNMGVRSTLSMSLIDNGRLWGLVSCNARLPRRLSVGVRARCELLARTMSLLLGPMDARQDADYKLHLQRQSAQLIGALTAAEEFSPALLSEADGLLELVHADGLVVVAGDTCRLVGATPTEVAIQALVSQLDQRSDGPVWAADALDERYSASAEWRDRAAGLLAVQVATGDPLYVLWFRLEQARLVHWGGEPKKELEITPQGARLHPRKSFEVWQQTVQGRSAPWLGFEVQAVRDLRTAMLNLVVQAQIAERERAEEAMRQSEQRADEYRARLADIVISSGEGILSVGLDGVVTAWNAGAERLYGYTAAEIVGKSGACLVPADRTDETQTLLERLGRGEHTANFETERVRKSGELLEVAVSVSLIHDGMGAIAGAATISHDIGERKHMERVIAEARDMAIQANRAKSEFLAVMSHEIRTPMNGVIGMNGLLLDTELDPQQRDYAEAVQRSGEGLLSLINDILDFSKIEAGKLDLELLGVDIRQVTEGVVELLSHDAEAKGLTFGCVVDSSVPGSLSGDAGRLRQVLMNLVSNAVKFTEHGDVHIRVSYLETPGATGRLRVAVADTGIGMSTKVRSRLFQPFMQADGSTTRKYGGTGLGLAISRRLVELMGGEIGVESSPGAGSTFWFKVPLVPRASADIHHPSAVPPHPLRAGIGPLLVVDDSPINQKVALGMLRKLGLRADTVANGFEALEAISRIAYAAVLMDCQMPELDGYDATRELRRREGDSGAHVPVIAMTAFAMADDRERCLAAGMDDYVSKPIRLPDVQTVLQRWLQPDHPDDSAMKIQPAA